MIQLTKLNGMQFALNCDLIETIQENPDTTIRLSNGNIYIVMESMETIQKMIIDFHRETFRDLLRRVTTTD